MLHHSLPSLENFCRCGINHPCRTKLNNAFPRERGSITYIWATNFCSVYRAGGLAWIRYRLDMAGVRSSNLRRPIALLITLIIPCLLRYVNQARPLYLTLIRKLTVICKDHNSRRGGMRTKEGLATQKQRSKNVTSWF
jgi:hypothetical protein